MIISLNWPLQAATAVLVGLTVWLGAGVPLGWPPDGFPGLPVAVAC
jgi:hypothetical protein